MSREKDGSALLTESMRIERDDLEGISFEFSEDLDFFLRRPDPGFSWKRYLEHVVRDGYGEGLSFDVQPKAEDKTAVKKALLRTDSFGKALGLLSRSIDQQGPWAGQGIEVDPGRLSTVMSPPMRLTNSLQMAGPNPVPDLIRRPFRVC